MEPASQTDGVRFSACADEAGEVSGRTKVELLIDGKCVSWLTVVPFTIRVGRATLRMDGIGGVGTDKGHRYKGYSRRVIEATIERMTGGDAAVSMLYGIPDFYPKFGYASAGADHSLSLTALWSKRAPTALPRGWSVRAFAKDDLAAVQRLYEANTSPPFAPYTVGAAVRGEDSPAWHELLRNVDEEAGGSQNGYRVAVDSSGRVRAYAWRNVRFWYADMLARRHREAFVLAEVMADGPEAADAILVACRLWAREGSEGNGDPFTQVLIPHPAEGPVAAGVARTDGRISQRTSETGESMVRVLSVERLITALGPELRGRLAESRVPAPAAVRFVTELGEATLELGGEGGEGALTARVPHQTLGQLAVGAHDPGDVLERLGGSLDGRTRGVLVALFPKRNQHMYAADRY